MTVNITSIANNADGTYDITFDAPPINTDPGNDHVQQQWLMWSATTEQWITCTTNAPESANTLTVTAATSDATCNLFIALGQPDAVDPGAGNTFAEAQPRTTTH